MISRAGSHAAGPLIMKAKNHALAGLKPSEVILRRLNCFWLGLIRKAGWLGLIRKAVPSALLYFTDFRIDYDQTDDTDLQITDFTDDMIHG